MSHVCCKTKGFLHDPSAAYNLDAGEKNRRRHFVLVALAISQQASIVLTICGDGLQPICQWSQTTTVSNSGTATCIPQQHDASPSATLSSTAVRAPQDLRATPYQNNALVHAYGMVPPYGANVNTVALVQHLNFPRLDFRVRSIKV